MTEPEDLYTQMKRLEGQEVGAPIPAPDPVNAPMIRHWCTAVDDRNPVYTDPEFAARSLHGGVVAPPTMLQAWSMPGLGPRTEPPARAKNPQRELFRLLDEAGFTSVVATNCSQEYARYLRPGDELTVTTEIESISDRKNTALGPGHFIDHHMTYRDQGGAIVATMRLRLLKFKPLQGRDAKKQEKSTRPRPRPAITPDNAFFWDGVRERKLLIQRCACGRLRHPPGPMCPSCRSLEWDSVEASGRGRVYSYVVAHHPPIPPFAYPNLIALIELEEGTRLVSNLVGVAPADVRVGMPVRVEFREFDGGQILPQFWPVDA